MLGIRRALRRWRPHVVHVHENHDPRLLALTSGYRTVLTVHDPLGHPGAPALTPSENWAFRRWFRRADRFVVHGQALVERARADRRTAVPSPSSTTGRTPRRAAPRAGRRRPSSCSAGWSSTRASRCSSPPCNLVWERRPDARLVVAGEGDAARLVPAEPRTTLLARYISEAEVDGVLAGASLVALPYTQASQSGVGLLAIAAGVPVVVSDLGALPELAYDGSFVSAAGDPRALAEAILRHLDDGGDVRGGCSTTPARTSRGSPPAGRPSSTASSRARARHERRRTTPLVRWSVTLRTGPRPEPIYVAPRCTTPVACACGFTRTTPFVKSRR